MIIKTFILCRDDDRCSYIFIHFLGTSQLRVGDTEASEADDVQGTGLSH